MVIRCDAISRRQAYQIFALALSNAVQVEHEELEAVPMFFWHRGKRLA